MADFGFLRRLDASLLTFIVLSILPINAYAGRVGESSKNPSNSSRAKLGSQWTGAMQGPTSGRLPLLFERNEGQADPPIQFLARGPGYISGFESRRVVFSFNTAAGTAVGSIQTRADGPYDFRLGNPDLTMEFEEANPATKIKNGNRLETLSNYYTGRDPGRWHTGISNYESATYAGLYPNIDLAFRGNQGQLEYDFLVEPGGDPAAIRIRIGGADNITIENGAAVLRTVSGKLIMHAPDLYQESDGVRREVSGKFILSRKNEIAFQVGAYDRTRPLVIDPLLVYSTYLNVPGQTKGLAVDAAGELIAVGDLRAVTKVNASGTALVYSTVLSGNQFDTTAFGVATDSAGDAYITGFSSNANFPTTPGAYKPSNSSCGTAFLVKLGPAGDIVYSTFLAGTCSGGSAVAVDASGNAYVTGNSSNDMQLLNSYSAQGNSFVQKLDANGHQLLYSTFFDESPGSTVVSPGTNPLSIAIDNNGSAYITGRTTSPNFSVRNAVQPALNGQQNAFVTKLAPAGNDITFSTFVGGSKSEEGDAIAVNPATGAVYVAGTSTSVDFPITPGASFAACANQENVSCNGPGTLVFALLLDPSGGSLVYSELLTAGSVGGATLDAAGNFYVAGATYDLTFPTVNSFEPAGIGQSGSAFVTELDATGAPIFSTILGGQFVNSGANGIAIDAGGSIYVAGTTDAKGDQPFPDFPLLNPLQSSPAGCCNLNEGFAAKIDPSRQGPVAIVSPLSAGSPFLRNVGTSPLIVTQISGAPPGGCIVPLTLDPGAACTLSLKAGQLTITSNSPYSPQQFSIGSAGIGASQSGLLAAPRTLSFGNQLVGTASAIKSFVVTNASTQPTGIQALLIRAPFSEQDNCPATLGPGASCTVSVTFQPAAEGPAGSTDAFQITYQFSSQGLMQPLFGFGVSNALVISTSAVSFGTQAVSGPAVPRPLILTNVSDGSLAIGSIVASPPFNQSNTCTAPLPPGGSCRVNITFVPNQDGPFTGTLQISHNSIGGSRTVQLSGTGTNTGALSVSPQSVELFSGIGVLSPPTTVTLQNTSTTSMAINSFTIAPSPFSIMQNTCPPSLAAAATCTLQVAATTPNPGVVTGTLSIGFAGKGSPQIISLSETAFPVLSVLPSQGVFSDQQVATTSLPMEFSVGSNPGNPVTVTNVSVTGDFQLTGPSCLFPLPHQFPGGFSCAISVTFSPSAAGIRTGSLSITASDDSSPHVFPLSGNGVTAGLEITPAAVQFPAQPVAVTSVSQTIVLTNTTAGTLVLQPINIPAPFVGTSNCGGSIPQGGSCSLQIAFLPTTIGTFSSTLSIQDSGDFVAHSVPLTGTGAGSTLVVSPLNLTFLDQPTGTASAALAVKVFNHMNASTPISAITATGDFTQTNDCGTSLASASFCSIMVTFRPSAAGFRTGAIVIADADSTSPQTVTLSGNGVSPPSIGWTPQSVEFGGVLTSATQPGQEEELFISNSGTGPLTIDSVSAAGLGFSADSQCGNELRPAAPGEFPLPNCPILIHFIPPSLGDFTGTVTLIDTSTGSPHNISLHAQGTHFVISGLASNLLLARNQTVPYTGTIDSDPAASATVTLTCSVSPAGPACAIPQPTLTLHQGNSFMVNILTSGTASSGGSYPYFIWPQTWGWRLTLLGAILFSAGFMVRTSLRRRFAADFILALTLVTVLSIALISCGGGSSVGGGAGGGGGTGGSQPTTYTVTVTGTSSESANPPQVVQFTFALP